MNMALFPEVVVNGETIPSAAIAAEAQNHSAPKDKPGIAWRKAAQCSAREAVSGSVASSRSTASIWRDTARSDSGSGAQKPVSEAMIHAVSKNVNLPLVVGGGIRTPKQAALSCQAGADVVVVGNALEKDPTLMLELAAAVHDCSLIHIK